jgi:hypothetical protein
VLTCSGTLRSGSEKIGQPLFEKAAQKLFLCSSREFRTLGQIQSSLFAAPAAWLFFFRKTTA